MDSDCGLSGAIFLGYGLSDNHDGLSGRRVAAVGWLGWVGLDLV